MDNHIFNIVVEEINQQLDTEVPIHSTSLLREDLGLPSIKMVMLLTNVITPLNLSIMDFNDYELMRINTVGDLVQLLTQKTNESIIDKLFDPDLVLENDKVQLRIIEAEDFDSLQKIAFDAKIWEYFTAEILSKEALLGFVDDALVDYENKRRVTFAIINKIDGQIVGSSSFGNISIADKRIEIGWSWLGLDFHGSGINQNYKNLMLQFAFEELGFTRVEFKTDILNMKARKALTKIGATEEGVLRSHTQMHHNRRRDTIYYSVLNEEWVS